MNAAIIDANIRNGVPPFALCHLLARQMRLQRVGSRGLRLSGPIAGTYPKSVYANTGHTLNSQRHDAAPSLPNLPVDEIVVSSELPYAVKDSRQELESRAMSGLALFRSHRAAGRTDFGESTFGNA